MNLQISLLPLLSRLDVHSLVLLYSAMLCERRIVFVSRHLPTLSACLHAATSLLYPFTWQVSSCVPFTACNAGVMLAFLVPLPCSKS